VQFRNVQRILLIKPSSLGDVICALPVLHGLRRQFPDAHLAWLVSRSLAPLIRHHPDLDDTIEFDRRAMRGLPFRHTARRALIDLIRRLRSQRFDCVIDLQGLWRSGFFTRATGARARIGFADAREMAWIFYNRRIQPPAGDIHAVDKNFLVASELGFADQNRVFDLAITDAERDRAADLLAEAGLDPDGAFAAILPGARWDTKQWLTDRFAEVIDGLQRQDHTPCLLLGGPDEVRRCEEVATLCHVSVVSMAGKTGLRELSAILERSAVVLCHDSGPMHLARALNRPIVCITGPTNPRRTGPYQSPESVLRKDLPCSPCYLRKLSRCRFAHECMTGLSSDSVLSRVRRALEPVCGPVDIQ